MLLVFAWTEISDIWARVGVGGLLPKNEEKHKEGARWRIEVVESVVAWTTDSCNCTSSLNIC